MVNAVNHLRQDYWEVVERIRELIALVKDPDDARRRSGLVTCVLEEETA